MEYSGHLDALERLLTLGERGAALEGVAAERAAALLGRSAQAFFRGEPARMEALARRALEDLGEGEHAARGRAYLYLGLAYDSQGRMAEAAKALARAREELAPLGNETGQLANLIELCEGRLWFGQGRLRRAAAALGEVAAGAAVGPGRDRPGAHVYLAEVAYEQGRLDEAEAHLARAEEAGRAGEGLRLWRSIPTLRARLLWARGRTDEAARALAAAAEAARARGNPAWAAGYRAELSRVRLAAGDVEGAEACIPTLPSAEGTPRYEDLPAHLAHARLAIARAREGGAAAELPATLDSLGRLDADAAAHGRLGDRVACLALLALGRQAAGEHEAARAALAEALRLGEPEGFVRVFLDEGLPMADLLRTATAARSECAAYSLRLRGAFGDATPRRLAATGAPAEPLSEREREVLRLVAEGRSAEEVAERLVISAHTARTHVRNIYAKLDAHNRAQAIHYASALHLI
jgi:LuxR family maltose regulon positive regulatory protein